MSSPFIGEIRMFGGNFNPAGWALCNGALMPISENDALFTLIGTTYGGDGQSTFGLPNLNGRVPIHMGTGSDGISYQIGESAGTESVTLTINQMAAHPHGFLASNDLNNAAGPGGNVMATTNVAKKVYLGGSPPTTPMAAQSIGPAGGSQPHDNMQPYLCITYIISLFGIFPRPS